MKFKTFLVTLTMFMFGITYSQGNKAKKPVSKYPETFTISKTDFDGFFKQELNSAVNSPGNKYIHKAILELNSLNGDMRLLRLKLGYFPKGILMIQVNGEHSTQVFITTGDKNLSYKGKVERGQVTLSKCKQEDIYTE